MGNGFSTSPQLSLLVSLLLLLSLLLHLAVITESVSSRPLQQQPLLHPDDGMSLLSSSSRDSSIGVPLSRVSLLLQQQQAAAAAASLAAAAGIDLPSVKGENGASFLQYSKFVSLSLSRERTTRQSLIIYI